MAKILTYQKSEFENLLPSDWSILLGTVRQVAASQNVPLYIVGGFVRDLLLGQPGSDFDLVVEGDAIGLAKSAAARYGGRVTSHGRFGTAKWLLADSSLNARLSNPLPALDFVLARSETYAHPGALPSVQPGALSDDLRRRDFSINTLAIRLDGQHYGELRDDLGGLEDLRDGLVRVLHPLSFVDDPTRMLRAVRYEQRYAFRIPNSDLELIPPARHLLAKLSADRVRHELDLILSENKAGDMLARMAELNLLASIHPSLPWDADLQRAIESGLEAIPPEGWGRLPDLARVPRRTALGYLLWLMRLSHEDIEALDFRLHFPASLREALQAAASVYKDLAGLVKMKPSQAFERLAEIQPLAVFACYLASGKEGRETLDHFMTSWRHVLPRTSGDDLIALGLPSGPLYQTILRSLRNAWLDGEVKTVDEEHSLLTRLIEKDGGNSH
jgi:tRNA nucleotidyltransferase (CCA-adding enzyme)